MCGECIACQKTDDCAECDFCKVCLHNLFLFAMTEVFVLHGSSVHMPWCCTCPQGQAKHRTKIRSKPG